jgi:pimeloyl-ACP methyl ester carboxylesterase
MARATQRCARSRPLLHHHPDLFGNGLSSSPSGPNISFPDISYHDAVAVQRRLLVEQFGISSIALVYGWSMGGMQAYHWAACHPDMVERAAIVCGSARARPATMSEKKMPIDSAVPAFWQVARIPEATPRCDDGTLLMIADVLGAENMP